MASPNIEPQGDMEAELVNYFGSIMQEDRVDRMGDIASFTQHIPSLVSPFQNVLLKKPVELVEVEEEIG